MQEKKADIIARLQKEIMLMQGFRPASGEVDLSSPLGLIRAAFPNGRFQLGAVHEFCCSRPEEGAASSGFVSGILSSLMNGGGASIWISASRMLFPPALAFFGLDPDKIIFIDLKKEKQVLWAIEEALKCEGLAAVVGELQEISFTESRRLQLAVEKSGVTGFLIRHQPKNLSTASVTRWKIQSLPGRETEMPGIHFPCWQVQLEKVRNGKTGSWQLEWKGGRFRHVQYLSSQTAEQQKKTG